MSERFSIHETPLDGVVRLARYPVDDSRGFLERLYCDTDLESVLGERRIRQINRTLTKDRGTVRGMHFQCGAMAESKIVTCLRGEIFDVALDLREDSPSFGRWHGITLCGAEHESFVIPEGVAHGFQALSDDCEMLYFHTEAYRPGAERAVNALDPAFGIKWPLSVTNMSDRDRDHPYVDANFEGS